MQTSTIQFRMDGLTPRERQVMNYVLLGAPNKAIARILNLSLRTVEHYRANLFRKMRVGNAIELMRCLQGHNDGWRAHLYGGVQPASAGGCSDVS